LATGRARKLREAAVTARFVGLSSEEVAKLRDRDPAIEAIRQLHKSGKRISFSWLRTFVGRDRDIWNQLGRGTSVLSSVEQLDQYLYSYGPMIACQWEAVTAGMSLPDRPVRLVDYGCGQGLASLLLFDKYGDAYASKLAKVVLVEPSPLALVRAEAILRCIVPGVEITCVNKAFDDLVTADLVAAEDLDTVHVFSNVLDVTGFDQYRLLGEVLTEGSHTIIAISPDRNFDGGTDRIRGLKAAVEDPGHSEKLSVSESVFTQFTCGPGGKYPAVSWVAKLEVSNG
jgi:SAM-dependent methyltransferase